MPMKAIVRHEYGTPDVIKLEEVQKPTPADNELLIRVYAASINRSDWEGVVGKPLYVRIGGLFKPKDGILGSDIAGTVEAVGKDIKQFKPGDDVFGLIMNYCGSLAEHAFISSKALALTHAGKKFAELAALPPPCVF